VITERQVKILALVAEGMTNDQIAAELSLPLGSVKRALERVYAQLEANDRSHAVLLALRAGVIE
jgi:DNA-binding NarL/FixJ family response regulator